MVEVTLTESLAAGDPEAFAALYDRLAGRLLGAARTMTGSAEDAQDVVQEVFVELARMRTRLTGILDLEAYMFAMLRNAVRRRGRRTAVDRRAVLALAQMHRATGAWSEAPRLPDDELAAAVARLPSTQRDVLALKIDGGLTFAEIAVVMETSLHTAASRYRYALERLRAALGGRKEKS